MTVYFEPADEKFLKSMQVRRQRISLRPGERRLAVCEIEVSGKDGSVIFTPNSALVAVFQNRVRLTSLLGEPREDLSTISDKPGTYQYRTDEVRLFLTFDEFERMVRLSLRPEEFLTLKGKAGIFHEIHDDFYNEETGTAIQPR